jgi:hypothetical protein
VPAEAKDTGYSELKDYFTKGLESLADQRKINAYLALISGGLGAAGGTSPHAMTNIGQGAQAGIQTYMAGNKDVAAQQAAMMQGRLGLEKYASLRDIQKGQAANLQAYHNTETQRKTEAAQMRNDTQKLAIKNASMARDEKLMEMQRKNFEAQAIAGVNSKWGKNNPQLMTDAGRAQFEADIEHAKNIAHLNLMQDPTFRGIYLRNHGVDPLDLMPKQPGQTGMPKVQNW